MHIYIPNKPNKVSFTFEGVIKQQRWNPVSKKFINTSIPNDKIIETIFRHACEGAEIHIIPKSYANRFDVYEIEKFIHWPKKLPIKSIVSTIALLQGEAIAMLKPDIHYDVKEFIIKLLPKNCVGILVEQPKFENILED